MKSLQINGVAWWERIVSGGRRERRTACNAPECKTSCVTEGVTPTLRRMPRAALAALICLSLVVLAGCGGGTASGGDDPASAVPANAAVYVDATVRPEGSQREDALAAAGKVLRSSDPQGKIDDLVAQLFAESEEPKLDYARDVKPWLGEKVALWLATTNGSDDFRGAVIAARPTRRPRRRRSTAP